MNNLTSKARIFSIAAHEAVQQKRKYTGESYYHHSSEVAMTVYAAYGTDDMIAAAYLHDVQEDCNITNELIEKEFGKEIAELVGWLSDVSKLEDGNRARRKEIDRLHTAQSSPQAKTIKLADLISNSKSILEHDKDFAKVYIKEKELLLEVLTEGDPTLYAQAKDIVEKAKKELGID